MALRLAEALEEVEDALHQKARLGIMSAVMSQGDASFVELKQALGLTDGNLSAHITVLEKHGYVSVEKSFRGKRPHTALKPTEEGRAAFVAYLAALERVIAQAREKHEI